MQELSPPFRKDHNNLWYINAHDVKTSEIIFHDLVKSYGERRHFYKIDGIDNYVIKDSTMYPLTFNRIKNLSLLKNLSCRQEEFTNIDFPVAYYQSFKMLKGIIIPYYEDSISLRKLIYLQSFDDLNTYYHQASNEMDNLITLLLEILELIVSMYDKNICYLDIHSGNFLLYNNSVKVIDFEPGYVYFQKKDKYYYRMAKNYAMLVERICHRFGFKEISLKPEGTFLETETKVKALRKELER